MQRSVGTAVATTTSPLAWQASQPAAVAEALLRELALTRGGGGGQAWGSRSGTDDAVDTLLDALSGSAQPPALWVPPHALGVLVRSYREHPELAGEAFAAEIKATRLPELKTIADEALLTGDGMIEAQAYRDAQQAMERLEKRIFYLKQARQIGIQQLPQIRIVQAGDETLVESLQASTRLTIPLWKQKMVLLLGLRRQEDALAMQKAVTDATNEMLRQTSSMMKDQAIAIEEQSQRGIVDLETLEQANRDLIDTLSGVLSTQEEGRQKRAMVEKRMDEMTQELRQALVQGRVT
jgi:hypothetical protein